MTDNQFIPNFNQVAKQSSEEVETMAVNDSQNDTVLHKLVGVSRLAILALFLLIPVFFMPQLWASLGFGKSILALVVMSVVVIAVSLMALRMSKVQTVLPVSLAIFWGVVVVALISGFASGDIQDALRGTYFEVQTAGFITLMGLLMTAVLVMQGSKAASVRAISLFGVSATVILLYNLLRVILGGDFLSLGTFSQVTVSPIGGFNDLAIFVGLTTILGLITLVQVPLNRVWQSVIIALTGVSVILLSIINFFNIWLVVGFFALMVLVYLLAKDSFLKNQSAQTEVIKKKVPIIVTAIICLVSGLFVFAGDYAGGLVNKVVDVNYAEVVPSLEGTIGVAKRVYETDAVLGVGPNRFVDAWRLHRDQTINQTLFWGTDFIKGSGFVPTLFINLGLLGGVLIFAFHICLLYLGYRTLLRTEVSDNKWYYIASVSFAASYFLWGMSYVYEPGPAMMILAALFTGLAFVSAGALLPRMVKNVPLVTNQKRGFFLMATAIVLVASMITMLIGVGKQYRAEATFNQAQRTLTSTDDFEVVANQAYELFNDDRFMRARAQLKIGEMNRLLAITEPTEENRQLFLQAVDQAQAFANTAIANDPTNPDNYIVLAAVYAGLAQAGVEGAKERVESELAKAQSYDPIDPSYSLVIAQLAVRVGDFELAKTEIAKALALKPNFTQALYLSAQIDISSGNTEEAIRKTQAIISLEPRNPTRYFQLGMLYAAEKRYEESITSFGRAIILDTEYANARYLLALSLLAIDEPEAALAHLKKVQETNADNQSLETLIRQVENGDLDEIPDLGIETPVEEVNPRETSVEADSALLDNVNTQPAEEEFLAEEVITDDSDDGEAETTLQETEETAVSSEEVTETE
ncbi:hypothetical protein KC851_03490 [Candidatus Kaiserbacteria bacterium]|nr:hypothetical protein [Candidatus Kaiserbacteria bacterium]